MTDMDDKPRMNVILGGSFTVVDRIYSNGQVERLVRPCGPAAIKWAEVALVPWPGADEVT